MRNSCCGDCRVLDYEGIELFAVGGHAFAAGLQQRMPLLEAKLRHATDNRVREARRTKRSGHSFERRNVNAMVRGS